MKEDHATYQLNDFIADDSFKEWVLGTSASAFWDNYLVQYPSQQRVVSDAKKLILSLRASQQSQEDDQVVEEIWKNIKRGTVKKSRIVIFRPVFLELPPQLPYLQFVLSVISFLKNKTTCSDGLGI